MFHGAMYGYEHANYMALENWINVYDGDLGIALSDTYTSDVFFKNFSKKHAKLYDGIRQDSGDPFRFIEKAINRYKELKVNPITKTIIFSDALTMDKAVEINNNCIGRIGCAFGIGTHLTNDCGLKPANIVMKLTECRMNSKQPSKHCVKLSDAEGKHMGSGYLRKRRTQCGARCVQGRDPGRQTGGGRCVPRHHAEEPRCKRR